jgi:hypothetical protein
LLPKRLRKFERFNCQVRQFNARTIDDIQPQLDRRQAISKLELVAVVLGLAIYATGK